MARSISEHFNLDTLLLVPAATPPHKDPGSISSAFDRYAMAVMATFGISRFRVSTIELENPGRPYTFETIAALRRMYGVETEIFFIVGSDSFDDLHKWKSPERILDNCSLIVAARPGYEISNATLALESQALKPRIEDLRGAALAGGRAREACQPGRIYLTDMIAVDISSSVIRSRIKQGLPIDGMAPGVVIEYIEKYKLYTRADGAVSRI